MTWLGIIYLILSAAFVIGWSKATDGLLQIIIVFIVWPALAVLIVAEKLRKL